MQLKDSKRKNKNEMLSNMEGRKGKSNSHVIGVL